MNKILITGGASGLGEAIVHQLVEDYDLIITYAGSSSNAQKLAQHNNVKAVHCDFRDSNQIDDLIALIQASDIDGIVFNAMTGYERKHFHKLPADYFFQSFNDNLLSTIILSQAAIKLFRKKKRGKIISILSAALHNQPIIGWSEYLAQKAYLKSLAKSWAAENARYGIQSNMISPSFMLTDIHKNMDPREIESIKEGYPNRALLSTSSVAHAVKFLLGADDSINGVDLIVNQGASVI